MDDGIQNKEGPRDGGNEALDAISIYFEDETITELFSELLQANGWSTKVLNKIEEVKPSTKIITEPRYFPMLSPDTQNKCLIVGNKNALQSINAICLSRPLTEEKIEEALNQFLRS